MGERVLRAFSADVIRAAEQAVRKTPDDDVLMRRAAAGLAAVCMQVLREVFGSVSGRKVALLVGTGHNGGDALLAGSRLRQRGVHVVAVLTGDGAYEPGLASLRQSGGRLVSLKADSASAESEVADADLVMDGVVGLSGAGGLAPDVGRLLAASGGRAVVVAVDVPSGVDCDTGEMSVDHVTADVTVTFGAMKPALLLPPAAYAAGEVRFVDVGIREHLGSVAVVERLSAEQVADLWPVPRRQDHKYTRGVLGVVAGSAMYPGAAVLACAGAVRAGVGIVRYVGPVEATSQVIAARPEVVPGTGRVQAWLLGSGVENDPAQDEAMAKALGSGAPCVVDAGALNGFVRLRRDGGVPAQPGELLLTPHAGELTGMLGLLGVPLERGDVEGLAALRL